MPLTAAVVDRIDALGAEVEALFAGEPENAAFYRACEQAGPEGFAWHYVAVREDGRLAAVAPAFSVAYHLDTTLPARLRRSLGRLLAAAPRLTTLKLAALGSPVAEHCHVGFAPGFPAERRPQAIAALLDGLAELAARGGHGLVGVKDLPDACLPLWRTVLAQRGFARVPGLPTALLDLGGLGGLGDPGGAGGIEPYLAGLSRATRKDLKRKARAFAAIRIEQRASIVDVAPRIDALYAETLARGELQFERLSAGYFEALLREMAPRASAVLYWYGERLIAFNIVLEAEGRLVDKYLGLAGDAVEVFSPYYNSWLHNVRLCRERGIPVYHAGQSLYAPKLRLGCRLEGNGLYFRHRNRLVNAALRLAAPLLAPGRSDPALAAAQRRGAA